MDSRKLLQQTFGLMLMGLLLVGCGGALGKPTPTPQPPGTVTGKVMYEALTNGGSAEPMPGVMVALCRAPAEGLPEGAPVAASNKDALEHICTLQEAPTALTDADGEFVLDGVPPAVYVVMFHLFPDEMAGVEWDGVVLTEAVLNEVDMEVSPSGESDFWEDGGPVIALANWRAGEGMTVATGNVCSNKVGFCFSVHSELLHSVVELEPNGTVEIELTTHFKASE